MPVHRRRFAPLWVYLFGFFAVAAAQRALLPPDEHTVAFSVAVFVAGAVVVGAVLTTLERRRR